MTRFTIPALTAAAIALAAAASTATADILVYDVVLDGPSESPPVPSPGTGTATVTIDTDLLTMRVDAEFMGLIGTTTLCHIHAPTAMPFMSTAGVATTTPTFPGFPAGVTSGMYDMTFDMTMASSFNGPFITNNGGNPTAAANALFGFIAQGRAYLNIHSTFAGGGEIRGFLVLAAPTCDQDLDGDGAVGSSDLALLLGTWGLPGPADFDMDGMVGSSDLAVMLGAWGPCP